MPRLRFYNRRFHVTSTRAKHHLWRLPAKPPWENPPAFDFETVPGAPGVSAVSSRKTALDHLTVIQPPTAPRLTARRWLRADRLPLSRRCAFALRGGVGAAACSAGGDLVASKPSDASCEPPARGA
jgi:hypothetical protein